MNKYTREQQILDKAIMDRTIALLGARTIGERQNECWDMLQDYVRIGRFWADEKLGDPATQIEVARMFRSLAGDDRISSFMLEPYERLLKRTKALIQAKIFRRKHKVETCEQPDVHIQKCFCANMQRGCLKGVGQ